MGYENCEVARSRQVNNSKSTYCRRGENGGIKDADKELLKLGRQLAKAQPELARMLT